MEHQNPKTTESTTSDDGPFELYVFVNKNFTLGQRRDSKYFSGYIASNCNPNYPKQIRREEVRKEKKNKKKRREHRNPGWNYFDDDNWFDPPSGNVEDVSRPQIPPTASPDSLLSIYRRASNLWDQKVGGGVPTEGQEANNGGEIIRSTTSTTTFRPSQECVADSAKSTSSQSGEDIHSIPIEHAYICPECKCVTTDAACCQSPNSSSSAIPIPTNKKITTERTPTILRSNNPETSSEDSRSSTCATSSTSELETSLDSPSRYKETPYDNRFNSGCFACLNNSGICYCWVDCGAPYCHPRTCGYPNIDPIITESERKKQEIERKTSSYKENSSQKTDFETSTTISKKNQNCSRLGSFSGYADNNNSPVVTRYSNQKGVTQYREESTLSSETENNNPLEYFKCDWSKVSNINQLPTQEHSITSGSNSSEFSTNIDYKQKIKETSNTGRIQGKEYISPSRIPFSTPTVNYGSIESEESKQTTFGKSNNFNDRFGSGSNNSSDNIGNFVPRSQTEKNEENIRIGRTNNEFENKLINLPGCFDTRDSTNQDDRGSESASGIYHRGTNSRLPCEGQKSTGNRNEDRTTTRNEKEIGKENERIQSESFPNRNSQDLSETKSRQDEKFRHLTFGGNLSGQYFGNLQLSKDFLGSVSSTSSPNPTGTNNEAFNSETPISGTGCDNNITRCSDSKYSDRPISFNSKSSLECPEKIERNEKDQGEGKIPSSGNFTSSKTPSGNYIKFAYEYNAKLNTYKRLPESGFFNNDWELIDYMIGKTFMAMNIKELTF